MSTLKEMYKGIPNSPEATLTSDINSSQTTITVSDANIIPEVPNILVIGGNTDNPETVKVTGKNGNTLTVERGFQGSAQAWEAGIKISRNFTAYDYNTLVENINDLQQQHNEHKADHVRIELSESVPSNPGTNTWWYEDLGETPDLGGGDVGLLLGNASTEEGDDVWFYEV